MNKSNVDKAYFGLICSIGEELLQTMPENLLNPRLGKARQSMMVGEQFLGLVVRALLKQPICCINEREALKNFLTNEENVLSLKKRIWTPEGVGFIFMVRALQDFLKEIKQEGAE